MNADFEDPGLVAAVQASTAKARRQLDAHPTHDQLLAYYDRELPDSEADVLREHLSLCDDCAQEALELASFSEQTASEAPAAQEVNAAWARTRDALERQGLTRRPDKKPGNVIRLWMFASPRLAYAAAAVFFITSVGLTLRLAELSHSLRALSGPRADPQVVGLKPLGIGGQRADDSRDPVTVAADRDLTLMLNLLDADVYPRHRVEISPRQGPTISIDVTLSPEADFTVLLPGRFLSAGPHEIRLYGIDDARGELLAKYELVVVDTD